MKKSSIFQTELEYEAPAVEIVNAAVEQGFASSYGDEGAAGGDLGWGGEYEF